jgi:transcriptional regulator with XRE-family HTH domain
MAHNVSNMGTRKVDQGETGHLVAANLRRLREEQHVSLHELSVRLAAFGRRILPSGLSKIEQGTRRVDVDDLVALADALGTVPSRLLRGRELPSDFDKQALHEEIREEAMLALRACEKAGISRYEIVEEMDMLDSVVRALPMLLPHLFRDGENPLEHAIRLTPSGRRSLGPLLDHLTTAERKEEDEQ